MPARRVDARSSRRTATSPARASLVLGACYRGGVKETAFSGVFATVEALRRRGRDSARPRSAVHDERAGRSRPRAVPRGEPVDAAVLQADHAEYRELGPADLPGVRTRARRARGAGARPLGGHQGALRRRRGASHAGRRMLDEIVDDEEKLQAKRVQLRCPNDSRSASSGWVTWASRWPPRWLSAVSRSTEWTPSRAFSISLEQGRPHIFEPGVEDVSATESAVTSSSGATSRPASTPSSSACPPPGSFDAKPTLDNLAAAARHVARSCGPESLVVVRSTVPVGATREVVLPTLLEAWGTAGS